MTQQRPRQCSQCQHFGLHRTCLEPEKAGLWHTFIIIWPPEGYGRTCAAWTARNRA